MKNRFTLNRGFSLVELIIVIAIMAVLIGILTPLYLRYVRRAKISVDVANADEIAMAINVAFTDFPDSIINGTPVAGVVTYAANAPIITDAAGNVTVAAPASEVQSNYQWYISYNATGTGVAEIRLGAASGTAAQIWPSALAYEAAN